MFVQGNWYLQYMEASPKVHFESGSLVECSEEYFLVKTGWPAAGPQHPSGLLGQGDSRHPSASLTLKGQIILLLRHYSLEYKSGQAYFKYIYFYGNSVVSIQPWSENFWNLKTSALYNLCRMRLGQYITDSIIFKRFCIRMACRNTFFGRESRFCELKQITVKPFSVCWNS